MNSFSPSPHCICTYCWTLSVNSDDYQQFMTYITFQGIITHGWWFWKEHILYQLVQIQTKLECDQDIFKVFSALCVYLFHIRNKETKIPNQNHCSYEAVQLPREKREKKTWN